MTLEQLLRMTVPVGPGCVAPEGTPMTPEFRVAVQHVAADGVYFIVHLNGHNGETLDFVARGNEITLNDFPRRGDLKRMTTAEIKIREAMLAVEEVGADVRLTRAVTLLDEAREAVADYVDGQLPCADPGVVKRGGPGSDAPHPFRR